MSLCKQLTSLQRLEFQGGGMSSMVKLTDEQERALQLLNSLQLLEFSCFPNLLSLPANLRSLISLKYVNIISCPSISGLPEMATTCSLFVSDCSEELSSRYKEWLQRREMMNIAEWQQRSEMMGDETLNVN
ncbi:hypothetical protein BAE44_0001756 [Dichanthelium oligosanthes]|uniref:Uncharacterized protein n=1 Tax=Dichanthelium oligosanthes TaxID=888268 RepID=A0A1E5WIK2_9POAL|nr:hypothetical protein BAE44_0001756 [Dichanthelium oligosanthes]